MSKKRILSFFDFMQQYPHATPGRVALASELKRLAVYNDEIEGINSLADLMIAASKVKDGKALASISGGLWGEYCAIAGRPFFEECFSNADNKKR